MGIGMGIIGIAPARSATHYRPIRRDETVPAARRRAISTKRRRRRHDRVAQIEVLASSGDNYGEILVVRLR